MKLRPIRKEDLTRKPIVATGSQLVDTIEIDPRDVYIPLLSEGVARNAVRTKLDQEHILQLQASLSQGVDPSETVPGVMRYERPKVINGKTYKYELVFGFHRQYAILKCMFELYVYDVYKFGVDGVPFLKSVRTLQLVENDKLPAKSSKGDEIANIIMELIEVGELPNDEDSIREYVEEVAAHKHGNTKTAIINKVVNNSGAYRDITTYTFDQAKAFLGNSGNYENDDPEYKLKFEYDVARKKRGATVLSGYEIEFIPQAMKHFLKDGSESYFNLHVKPPKEGKTVQDVREDMIKSIGDIEESILAAADFHKKNGRFPWTLESFLPQDNKSGEDKFISIV